MSCLSLCRFESRSMKFQVWSAALAVTLGLIQPVTGTAGDTPVADAAEKSDRSAIRMLLKQHADVNAAQPDGMTALHWAAYLEDFETAKLLAKAGAEVTTNAYGVTPLSLACLNGNASLVEVLLDA